MGVLTREVGISWNDFVMKLLFGLLALPLLSNSSFSQTAVAQKEYILAKKVAPLPTGKKFKVVKNMSMPDTRVGIEVRGRQMDRTMSRSNKDESIFEFVSDDKIRVTYLKKRGLKRTSAGGQEQEEEEVEVAEGKSFILEKKEGKWTGKLEEGEVEEADQESIDKVIKRLEQTFNQSNDEHMYGTEPRKVGDSWEVDPTFMPGMDEVDITGGKMTMTFLEVKNYEGEPCAVLRTSFAMDGTPEEEMMKGAVVKLTGNGRILRSLNHLADFKFTGEMTMKMTGDFEPQPGIKAKMTMNGSMKMDMRTSEVKEGE